jgi:hypothetical protein
MTAVGYFSNIHKVPRFFQLVLTASVLLCALFILLRHALGQEIELRPAEDAVVCSAAGQLTCKLVNPTLRTVEYGAPFYLEYLSPSGWEPVNDRNMDVNFQLPLYTLAPLISKRITFSLSLYSNMERPGSYRIRFPVRVAGDARDLYCQFTVS